MPQSDKPFTATSTGQDFDQGQQFPSFPEPLFKFLDRVEERRELFQRQAERSRDREDRRRFLFFGAALVFAFVTFFAGVWFSAKAFDQSSEVAAVADVRDSRGG